jgi:hypothetical protein
MSQRYRGRAKDMMTYIVIVATRFLAVEIVGEHQPSNKFGISLKDLIGYFKRIEYKRRIESCGTSTNDADGHVVANLRDRGKKTPDRTIHARAMQHVIILLVKLFEDIVRTSSVDIRGRSHANESKSVRDSMALMDMFCEDGISYTALVFDRELERVDGVCARISVPIVLEFQDRRSSSRKGGEGPTWSSKASSSLRT